MSRLVISAIVFGAAFAIAAALELAPGPVHTVTSIYLLYLASLAAVGTIAIIEWLIAKFG